MVVLLRICFLLTYVTLINSESRLTILHTNDVHAHFAPFDKYGSECSQSKIQQGQCYGGVARIKAIVDKLRSTNPNIVFCDAGDQFQGALWFFIHHGNITSHFMNILGYDVMGAGNHEFDDGEDELIRFSHSVSFPVVSANLIQDGVTGKTPSNVTKSTILNVNGQQVAFIGFTTKDTSQISNPGRYKFSDEVEAVKEEAAKLKAQGINKIIALGHAGFHIDIKIAEMVPNIDMVIGGHTNTFLYNGPPPDREVPVGPYPYVVTQASGRRVPVMQDYRFGKYLGYLNVTFDDDGELTAWSGNPILLNSDYPEDSATEADLNEWRGPLEDIMNTVVGRTHVYLEEGSCRYKECNLGNIVTESFIAVFNRNPPGNSWARVGIAMINGGAMRMGLPKGDITLSDVYNTHPFGNTVDLFFMQGRHIWEVLEFSIKEKYRKGGFMQFSGLRVEYMYDMNSPNMSKVMSVQVRCTDCPAPVFSPLEMDVYYEIAANSFLIGGGDGYYHFKKYAKNFTYAGEIDADLFQAYLRSYPSITQGYDGRIVIRKTTSTLVPLTCASSAYALTPFHLSLIFSALIILFEITSKEF